MIDKWTGEPPLAFRAVVRSLHLYYILFQTLENPFAAYILNPILKQHQMTPFSPIPPWVHPQAPGFDSSFITASSQRPDLLGENGGPLVEALDLQLSHTLAVLDSNNHCFADSQSEFNPRGRWRRKVSRLQQYDEQKGKTSPQKPADEGQEHETSRSGKCKARKQPECRQEEPSISMPRPGRN